MKAGVAVTLRKAFLSHPTAMLTDNFLLELELDGFSYEWVHRDHVVAKVKRVGHDVTGLTGHFRELSLHGSMLAEKLGGLTDNQRLGLLALEVVRASGRIVKRLGVR